MSSDSGDPAGLTVAVDLPFPIPLSDGTFDLVVDGQAARVSLTRVRQTALDPRLGIEKTDLDLQTDRRGWLAYTHASVQLSVANDFTLVSPDPDNISSSDTDSQTATQLQRLAPEEALGVCLRAVNLVVDQCRALGRIVHLRHVARDEIFVANVQLQRPDEPIEGVVLTSYSDGLSPPVIGLKEELEEQIRGALLADRRLGLHGDLMLRAWDYLDHGEYRLALVEACTALDVAVDGVLFEHYGSSSDPITAVRKALDVGGSRWALDQIINWAAGDDKTRHALELGQVGTGWSGEGATWAAWQRWRRARRARNDAVHRAVSPSMRVTKEAVGTFLDMLQMLLGDPYGPPFVAIKTNPETSGLVGCFGHYGIPVPEAVLTLFEAYSSKADASLSFRQASEGAHGGEGVAIESDGAYVAVYVDPKNKSKLDGAALTSWVALALDRLLMAEEGYPYARRAPDDMDFVSRAEFFEVIATILTSSVSQLAGYERLRARGLDPLPVIEQDRSRTLAILKRSDLFPVNPDSVFAFSLPLRFMRLALSGDGEKLAEARHVLGTGAPELLGLGEELAEAVQSAGWSDAGEVLNALRRARDAYGLRILDTVEVCDPRTRLAYGCTYGSRPM